MLRPDREMVGLGYRRIGPLLDFLARRVLWLLT